MFWTVEVMSALAEATDSTFNPPWLCISNWKETVNSEPLGLIPCPLLLDAPAFEWSRPSSEMVIPDGRSGTIDDSPPCIALLKSGTLIGVYMIYDPKGCMKASWIISTVAEGLRDCSAWMIKVSLIMFIPNYSNNNESK